MLNLKERMVDNMEIKAFCDKCQRETKCNVVGIQDSDTSFKIVTLECTECGCTFKEELNI